MKTFILPAFVIFLFTFTGCKKNDVGLTKSISNEIVSGASGTTKGLKYGKMTDIDGNVYKTIQIGKQIWMAENLRVTRYRNGDYIPEITDPMEWSYKSSGAWCYYNNSSSFNLSYGKLYNWHSLVDERILAPKGWHIPSDAEWDSLAIYLGGYEIAGGKMKSPGTISDNTGLWVSPNLIESPYSGFNAVPGGLRWPDVGYEGTFHDFGGIAIYWSITENAIDNNNANSIYMGNVWTQFRLNTGKKESGLSVRCIRDK